MIKYELIELVNQKKKPILRQKCQTFHGCAFYSVIISDFYIAASFISLDFFLLLIRQNTVMDICHSFLLFYRTKQANKPSRHINAAYFSI